MIIHRLGHIYALRGIFRFGQPSRSRNDRVQAPGRKALSHLLKEATFVDRQLLCLSRLEMRYPLCPLGSLIDRRGHVPETYKSFNDQEGSGRNVDHDTKAERQRESNANEREEGD